MRDATPPILPRLYRKLRAVALYPKFRQYVDGIGPDHPFHGMQMRVVGDASADPTEFFDHYDAYACWASRKIFARGRPLKTLDIGSTKIMGGILSAVHNVTSLVLADCGDSISRVTYVKHDASDPLPFPDNSFDAFTSMVALPLIGLARYGDKLDPNSLVKLIAELKRVIKPDGDVLVSMCLGHNVLNFNNGWFLTMDALKRAFVGWTVVDHLVDRQSSPRSVPIMTDRRFTQDTSTETIAAGDYRVIFLHLRHADAPACGDTVISK
jgi:SAM-dependent methyltransferase